MPVRRPKEAPAADVIVTAAPIYRPLDALRGEERFPKGAQLLLVHQGKAEPLVSGFAATADANVSADAKTVLFAGKKASTDSWEIWELTLADRSVQMVRDVSADGDFSSAVDDRTGFAASAARVRVLCAKLGREPFAARQSAQLELLEASVSSQAISLPQGDGIAAVSTTFGDRVHAECAAPPEGQGPHIF